MCKNSRILSRTKNGELSICKSCKTYSLVFNNLLLQFDRKQLQQFRKHISNINIKYWLNYYSKTTQKRKIPVATQQQNLILFFTQKEFNELKSVIMISKNIKDNLSVADINYPLILN